MHRVDSPGSVDGFFQDGNPSTNLWPTQALSAWHNDVQENIVQVILGAGIALVKGSGSQLLAAIATFITAAREAAIATAAGDATTKANAARDAAITAAVAAARVPVGLSMFNNSTVVPAGWYEEDGAAKTRAGDPDLWAYAQASGMLAADAADKLANPFKFGRGDGATTFELPDKRGLFYRVWDHGAGRDPGRGLGTYVADAFQGHRMSLPGMPRNGSGSSYGGGGAGVQVSSNETQTGDPITDGVNGPPRTANETRPVSGAAMSIIKR